MAYEDFSMEHYKLLLDERKKDKEEIIKLRNQLNEKDEERIALDNLTYKQNIRLANYDSLVKETQRKGGSIVGSLNKYLNNNFVKE